VYVQCFKLKVTATENVHSIYMGLIIEKSVIVILWRGIFDSVDITWSILANRLIFRQQNCLNYHDINKSSKSGHAYSEYYFRLFHKHCKIRKD